jgi:hypothetical protein
MPGCPMRAGTGHPGHGGGRRQLGFGHVLARVLPGKLPKTIPGKIGRVELRSRGRDLHSGGSGENAGIDFFELFYPVLGITGLNRTSCR